MFCNGEKSLLAPAAGESQHEVSVEEAEEDLEKVVEVKAFKCEQCGNDFKSENGLNIHIGKAHKVILTPPPPDRLRQYSGHQIFPLLGGQQGGSRGGEGGASLTSPTPCLHLNLPHLMLGVLAFAVRGVSTGTVWLRPVDTTS